MEEIRKEKGKMNDMTSSIECKTSGNATSGKPTKSVKDQPAIASQPVDTTDGSQTPNEIENGLSVPSMNDSTPDATANIANPSKPVKGDDNWDLLKRLTFRWACNREAREALGYKRWQVVFQLIGEGLPVSDNEELEALTARWLELSIIIAGNPGNRQSLERGRAFLKEFLHLACGPAVSPAPAVSQAT